MASHQIDIPQPSLQQAVMTSHHPHPTTAAATTANHNERATSSKHKWLLPINGRKQIQAQRRPSVSQHEPEPSATIHQIISTSPSPALVSDNSVACAAKRKVPDFAPRDEEQRDGHPRHVTTSLKGRGGVRANEIWISQDEGANIMMEATMALKSSRHLKRARMVASDSNDGESSRFLLPPNVVLMICRDRHRDTTFLAKQRWRCATASRAIWAAWISEGNRN
jgi:hypothetical protein